MTSRNYLCKGIKENIRRNFYLMIFITLAFFAAFPIQTIMRLDGAKHVNYQTTGTLTFVEEQFINCIGADNLLAYAVVIGSALLLGIVGFYYLYSGEKTDFYHSLPLRREELFCIVFVSGFLIFLIPYVVSVGFTYIVGFAYGAVTTEAVAGTGIALGINVLYFLVIYEAAVLAVLFTGNLFTGVLGFGGFMVYGPLVYGAYDYLNSRFFDTLANHISNSPILEYLSPIGAYISAMVDYSYYYRGGKDNGMGLLIYGVVLAVILLAADIFVYKIRPSESFQKAIAFEKLQPLIKVFAVLPISILAALAFSGSMGYSFRWLVASAVIIAIVLCAAFEFLYTMDIKKCIRPKKSAGIVIAALLLIFAGYRKDIAGVDSYLPDKGKVENMSVFIDSINERIAYPDSYHYYGPKDFLDYAQIKNFDAVYKMAQMGVEYFEKDGTSQNHINEAVSVREVEYPEIREAGNDTFVSFYIAYHLKSGKKVYRNYVIPETEELVKCIGEVYDNWEYREKMLPTSYLEAEDIKYLRVKDFYRDRKPVDIQGDSLKNIYKTYKTELESAGFEQCQKDRVIGYLDFEVTLEGNEYGEDVISYYQYPVYESFNKTRELLEKSGAALKDRISMEDIYEVRLSVFNEELGERKDMTVEKPSDIEKVLENITYEEQRYGVGSHINYDVYVVVYWKDRNQEASSFSLMKNEELNGILEKLYND